MPKYKADAYLRVSYAPDGSVESDSIANQKKLIEDFITSHPDIEIVSERVDDGYSGVLFDRPAFQEMMKDIQEGKINCVIVKDLSRLGREYIETGRYLQRIFPAYGVRFISVNDNIDTTNERNGDDLTVSLKNILNDAYCHDISVKTRSALQTKRKRGDYVGACPVYGYLKSPENRNRLVVDEETAPVIRDIYRRRLEGASALKIAEELNRLGVPSPLAYKINRGLPHSTGGFSDKPDPKWSAQEIIRILSDETYTGVLLQGKQGTHNHKLKEMIRKPAEEWVRTENAHEAIISNADYELVQRIAKLDTRTAPDGDTVYLFSGLLICGSCGGRMTRKTNTFGDKKLYYYRCPTGKKHGCEHPVMLREDALKKCVLDSLQAHIKNVLSLKKLLDSIDAEKLEQDVSEARRVRIAENETRLEKARQYRAALYEDFAGGILTKEEYRDLKKRFTVQIEQAREAIDRLHQEIDEASSSTKHRWAARYEAFAGITELDRRTVISLIQSIKVLGKEELEITFRYQAEYDEAQARLIVAKEAV